MHDFPEDSDESVAAVFGVLGFVIAVFTMLGIFVYCLLSYSPR